MLRMARVLLLEFHYTYFRSSTVGTKMNVDEAHHHIFEKLYNSGFVIYHKEPNVRYGEGCCIEYAFLRLAKNLKADN